MQTTIPSEEVTFTTELISAGRVVVAIAQLQVVQLGSSVSPALH